MRKFLLAASISAALLSASAVCIAAPVAVQNRENGNIEISGLEQTSVTVQVLKPDYEEGSDVTKSDIVNIMLFETHNGKVTIPVEIENDDMYTVKVNGRTSEALWQTKLKCYSGDTLSSVMTTLKSGTADEILDSFDEKEKREILGIDESAYVSFTPEGRKMWANTVKEAAISSIGDYVSVYDSQFPIIAVSYAKNGEAAATILDKYKESILDADLLGYDDYEGFDEDEKADMCERIISNPQTDKAKFVQVFSDAAFLTAVANVDGGADVNSVMKKYKELLSDDVDDYFSKKNTYSVDSNIAGVSFDSIEKLEERITDILEGKSSGGGNSGGSGGSGSFGGGGTTHISATMTEPLSKGEGFVDLDSVLWAKEAILELGKEGIVSGDGQGSFRPLDSITREEFVKLLTLAFDENVNGVGASFVDVDVNAWYYPYVASGYSKGLIKGITMDNFGIGEKITRQDMIVLIYRYLIHSGVNMEKGDVLTFDDKAQIGEYALDAVYALSSNGIIKGMEDGTFRPYANSNRAEAAQIIFNALEFSRGYKQ